MSVIPNYPVTHRCAPCRTFDTQAGRCAVCGEWLTPIEEMTAVTPKPACPDWPDVDNDAAEFRRTVRQAPRRRTRTRKVAA